MGGENPAEEASEESADGSSPRGRGKRRHRPCRGRGGRLIPAWAGKTPLVPRTSIRPPAHPRVGGENQGLQDRRHSRCGSSPRGRGKRRVCAPGTGFPGLIPAWAGKTRRRVFRTGGYGAHPRVGGENPAATSTRLEPAGSSPRGRGKLTDRARLRGCGGLIPAWAGKTCPRRAHSRPLAAHPRVGGENTF